MAKTREISTEKSNLDLIRGAFGSFPLTGATYADLTSLKIGAIIGGASGASITTLTIVGSDEIENEYADQTGTYTWNGSSLSPGDIIEIPVGYFVKQLIFTGDAKVLLSDRIEFKPVV